MPKKGNKSSLEEIINAIKTKFAKQSGIVYCFSRKDCDSCAETLRKSGIKAESYHAGLSDKRRNEVQSQWVSNKFQVGKPTDDRTRTYLPFTAARPVGR